jgi:hypothetical protein
MVGSNTWVNGISIEPGTGAAKLATFRDKVKSIKHFGSPDTLDGSASKSGMPTAISNNGSGFEREIEYLVLEIRRFL